MAIEEPGARPEGESGGHEHVLSDGLRMIRAAMEESFAGVVVTDAAGVIEYANRSFERTSGYGAAELIGRSIAGLSANEELEQSIWAVLNAEDRWRGEIKNKRPDGEVYYLLATIQPLRSDDGEITHYIGVNIDITERVKTEEALASREAYWRALVENAPDHILSVDRDGVIMSLNWALPETTVDETVGRTVYDFVREEYHDVWREALANVFASGQRAEFEVRTIDGPAGDQWYENTLSAVYDGDVVIAAIASARNVTARKETEEALAEREAYWRALVKNAPDLIAEVDREGVIARLNRDPVGSTMEAVVGKTVYEFSLPESHDVWREALAKAFTEGVRVDFEARELDGNGEAGWYATSIAPVCADGGVVAAIVSERDITVRREAEEELAEREAYWRALVENAPDHILTVDEDGVITSLNRSVSGITVDDVVGRTVYDVVREEYQDVWREALAEVFSGGERVEFEVRTFDIPGEKQSYAVTLSGVSEGDTVVAGIASIRNITALKETQERMRAIATAISDVIVVVDEDGLLHEVLAPTKKDGLLFLPPDELRGMRLHEFLPREQVEQTIEFVRATVSAGRALEGEVQVDLPQGPTWLFCRSAPLSLSDGRVVAVIHILDVTERKRLEEELQRVREETEAEAEEGVKRAAEYGLTFREITVLSLIARGKSDREIAVLLGLSPFTVNKHSSNLVRKLEARSRSQAAALAVREGII